MARTKASAAASTSAYPAQWRTRALFQEAKDPNFDPNDEMTDAKYETSVEEPAAHGAPTLRATTINRFTTTLASESPRPSGDITPSIAPTMSSLKEV